MFPTTLDPNNLVACDPSFEPVPLVVDHLGMRNPAVGRSIRTLLFLVIAAVAGCSSSQTEFVDVDPDPSRQTEVIGFIWEYEARVAEGDFEWLVDAMPPGTFEFWTPEECKETLVAKWQLQRPIQELGDSTYFSGFSFDYGQGRRGDYTDLYRTDVTRLAPDGVEDGVFTVSFFEGEPKWFGNCDLPPAL